MNILGKIDNISNFKNEDFNCHFKYMNEKQSLALAKRVFGEFISSKRKNIIAIESGTAPLIELIKGLDEWKSADINLIQLKIPRELNFNLFDFFKTYLSTQELKEKCLLDGIEDLRENHLKKLVETFPLKTLIKAKEFDIYDSIEDRFEYDEEALGKFNEVLSGTKISQFFHTKFLVFDEYINAGTIIRNFNLLAKLIALKADYKLSAFCMFLNNPAKIEKIAFTLYSKESEFECYKNGAYPFENRIDLIGYYFYCGEHFEKVYLTELYEKFNKTRDISQFLKKLEKFISINKLEKKLKVYCKIKPVKNFVGKNDIARFILKKLELEEFGQSSYSDLLDQVFELYAPAWSPMPVKNHLDFWQAFEKLENDITFSKEEREAYRENREGLFNFIISKLLLSREKWLGKIRRLK